MKRAVFSAVVALLAFASAFAAHATSLKWDGGGDRVNFSDPKNWEGDVAPAAASDSYRLEFNGAANGKSLVNDIVGLSVTNVTFGSNATSPVTISGQPLTNCVKILNNTTNSTHHIFKCEVVCKNGTTPDIPRAANKYIKFPGGLTLQDLPKTGSKTEDYWCGKITVSGSSVQTYGATANWGILTGAGSTLSAPKAIFDHFKFSAGTTGTVESITETDCRRGWGSGYCALVFDSLHGVLKAGEIKSTGDTIFFHSFAGSDNGYYGGTIEAKKLTCATTKNTGGAYNQARFFLNCGQMYSWYVAPGSTGEGIWAIGSGGLSFGTGITDESNYRIQLGAEQNGRPGATLYSYEDWALDEHPNGAANTALFLNKSNNGTSYSNTLLVIDTSHYKTGDETLDTATNHTVTLNGRVAGDGVMGVKGSGTVVFANTSTDFSGGLWASNSVRIVVNSGCKPGSGKVTLRDTSALELKNGASVGGAVDVGYLTTLLLPDTGTVTVGGQLWMRNKSKMKFRIDGSENAKIVLAGSYKIEKGVEISFTEDSVPTVGLSYTLTDGAEFTDAMLDSGTSPSSYFTLVDGIQGSLSIVNGELVYTVPEYFYIRIADGASQNLEIPWQWMIDNEVASFADADAAVKAALLENGKNGMPVWQSYCLGLEPANPESVVLCNAAPTQLGGDAVSIVAKNLNIPDGLEGVAVTAYLDRKSGAGAWMQQSKTVVSPGGSVEFTADADPESAISFFA